VVWEGEGSGRNEKRLEVRKVDWDGRQKTGCAGKGRLTLR